MMMQAASARLRAPLARVASGPARPRRSFSAGDWEFDVVIVGGGVVGSALACRLADEPALAGRRIALVEARRPRLPGAENATVLSEALRARGRAPHPRVYALSPSSVATLRRAEAWEPISSAGAAPPFGRMQVWDGPRAGEGALGGHICFDAGEHGFAELGFVAEDVAIHASLLERLDDLHASARLELCCPAQLERVQFYPPGAAGAPPDAASITLRAPDASTGESSTRSVRARLVVAADGAQSRVRAARGLASWGWGYGQRAIVSTVRAANTGVAWQRYLANGPLALLPLWDDYYSIVWSTSPDHAAELTALSDADFVEQLNLALSQSPPRPFPLPALPVPFAAPAFEAPPTIRALESARLAFDLQLQQASVYADARVALVGDAAHSLHPMAGQGLNLGLADVEALVRTLVHGAEVRRRRDEMGGRDGCARESLFRLSIPLPLAGRPRLGRPPPAPAVRSRETPREPGDDGRARRAAPPLRRRHRRTRVRARRAGRAARAAGGVVDAQRRPRRAERRRAGEGGPRAIRHGPGAELSVSTAGYPSPSPSLSTAMNASCGTETRPTDFMRFLPLACFCRSFFFREMSPP